MRAAPSRLVRHLRRLTPLPRDWALFCLNHLTPFVGGIYSTESLTCRRENMSFASRVRTRFLTVSFLLFVILSLSAGNPTALAGRHATPDETPADLATAVERG